MVTDGLGGGTGKVCADKVKNTPARITQENKIVFIR
jgi:hypothetical protein